MSLYNFNYELIMKDLSNLCLTTDICGTCAKHQCLIGYGKKAITECIMKESLKVENGMEQIPSYDLKLFHEEYFVEGIAHILQQCKSCKENHSDDCIINVIRSCYEVAFLGEPQQYQGSTFMYLNKIQESNPEIAEQIIAYYNCSNKQL